MYTHRLFVRAMFVLVIAGTPAVGQDSPGLGQPITEEDVAAWDISIGPDGDGLPAGQGTVAEGEAIYLAQCVACHGEEGQGSLNDRLAGGHGTLSGPRPVKTIGSFWPYATTVFDYVRRAMPYANSQSLSDNDVYALTAYLLYVNDIIPADQVMDAQSLVEVEMPNRENFVPAWPISADGQ